MLRLPIFMKKTIPCGGAPSTGARAEHWCVSAEKWKRSWAIVLLPAWQQSLLCLLLPLALLLLPLLLLPLLLLLLPLPLPLPLLRLSCCPCCCCCC